MEDPLQNLPTENAPILSLISTVRVPNVPPTFDVPYRLAIIGEAPGEDEESYRLPFIGASGRLLDSILGSSGVHRSGAFIGNVCKFRPPGNDIKAFGYDHLKVQQGLAELKDELAIFKPNCILALGNTPMWAATGKPYGLKDSGFSISEYRGSIQWSSVFNCKVVGAYHPAFILREYKNWVLLRFDTMRARAESESPDLILPQRNFELDLSAYEICNRLDNWPAGVQASIDIEGGLLGWVCMSVVWDPLGGFIIAFGKYSDSEKAQVYRSVSRFLYRDDVPKVLQNCLYEGFVLGYGFNMVIRNVAEDTMLKSWEIYSELPKGLDTVASIWTREPQWKHLIAYSKKEQLKRAKAGVSPANEIRNKHIACCIDSAVTLEASLAQDSVLAGSGLRHYRTNVGLLNPLLYMELRGIRYDASTAATELAQVKASLLECTSRLELRAGKSLVGDKGSISTTKLKQVLYHEKGYPEQKKGRGANAKVSTDVEALLNLSKKYPNDAFLADILLHRKLESIQETLEISADPDGRVRCGYNLVGTETGRLTCYTSPTGSGANLQTITKKLRKLYVADPDYWFFQCDLSGADGWTVAAYCLRHGDPIMWNDYMFGLKPAKIVALMSEHGTAATACSLDELKERCTLVNEDGYLYFTCKRIQHATNYGVTERTVSTQIMVDSYKITGTPVHVPPKVCGELQRLYFARYPGLYQWHEWAKKEVLEGRNSVSASGHERKFFGRRRGWNYKRRCAEADHDTWKEFLANEPQENTTHATNTAMGRLWNDPDNRVGGIVLQSAGDTYRATRRKTEGGLIIQNLHSVHDALIGQFHKSVTEWAVPKINSYFDNELTIASSKLVIPGPGAYGPSWGELGEKYGGGKI